MWFAEQHPGEVDAVDALAAAIFVDFTPAELAAALARDEALALNPAVMELLDIFKKQDLPDEEDALKAIEATIEEKRKAAKAGAPGSASQPRSALLTRHRPFSLFRRAWRSH